MLYKNRQTDNSEFESTEWFKAKIVETNEVIWAKMRRPTDQSVDPIVYFVGMVGSNTFGCVGLSSAIKRLKTIRFKNQPIFADNQQMIQSQFEYRW